MIRRNCYYKDVVFKGEDDKKPLVADIVLNRKNLVVVLDFVAVAKLKFPNVCTLAASCVFLMSFQFPNHGVLVVHVLVC